jgi:long-chain acyl-CoA synthetase
MRYETLIDFFGQLASNSGDYITYESGYRSKTFSYSEVVGAAREFALRLHGKNIKKGDNVVIWSENRPEWVIAFWGCLITGAIVVPVDYQSSPDFLKKVIGIVGAPLLLVGEETVMPSLDGETEVWSLADIALPRGSSPSESIKYHGNTGTRGVDTEGDFQSTCSIVRDDVAEIIFTSGATAEPKGVVLSHGNILANLTPIEKEAAKFRKYLRLFLPIRFLILPPLSHLFGQVTALFIAPMIAGTVVFMHGYNPFDIVYQIRKRRISVLVCVPKMLDVLRAHLITQKAPVSKLADRSLHIARRWLKHWRVHRLFGLKFWSFIVGAAPLDSDLEEFWSRLGFVVIQGYGLTETAPIVTFNNPLKVSRGSVGKAIPGIEMKIAPDGEILIKGETVTHGYFKSPSETEEAFEGGWFHTGDIGSLDEHGNLYIRGRKKEVIVTPEGMNVFPEDVEHVLNGLPGVRESAVIGVRTDGEERVHAIVVPDRTSSEYKGVIDIEGLMRGANSRLADHQKIRGITEWPGERLPRTEGTQKLKRREVKKWYESGKKGYEIYDARDSIASIIERVYGDKIKGPAATIEELGLSSLERVELLMEIEDKFQTHLDEERFAQARDVGEIRRLIENAQARPAVEPVEFPSWSRHWIARMFRRLSLVTWVLPISAIFAWIRVDGLENLKSLDGPVIFASNHQSSLDAPVILRSLPSRRRYNVAPAMGKEFFRAYFHPKEYTRWEWFLKGIEYYLASLLFNTFPIPQRETGTRQTLRYIGELVDEGNSILIFPEGERTDKGEIREFQPGVGMIGSMLGIPVVPVYVDGVYRVLHRSWTFPRLGRVRVVFGPPLHLEGKDYQSLARDVERAVKQLQQL